MARKHLIGVLILLFVIFLLLLHIYGQTGTIANNAQGISSTIGMRLDHLQDKLDRIQDLDP